MCFVFNIYQIEKPEYAKSSYQDDTFLMTSLPKCMCISAKDNNCVLFDESTGNTRDVSVWTYC